MITEYHTESGSIYEVDDKNMKMRQIKRSAACTSGRVSGEWRNYEHLTIGSNLLFVWGTGKDEHSDKATQIGADEGGIVIRHTLSTRIVKTVVQDTVA